MRGQGKAGERQRKVKERRGRQVSERSRKGRGKAAGGQGKAVTGSGRSRKGREKAGEKQWFQARSGREQAVEGPGAVPHRCVAAGEDELAGHTASDGAVWVLEEASGAADLSEPGHCRDSQTVSRRCPDGVHKVSGTQSNSCRGTLTLPPPTTPQQPPQTALHDILDFKV